ncbi:MAG: bifunctional UDP-N-acetylglucosamine diphosphorylase/glucosamine-1-phosphate N-acetyltransferase GlmU [Burkholderiaceae bacterium]
MSFPVDVVVMAAGKGTRMKSSKPKVLHRLGGRALAQHVIDTAVGVSARSVVVVTGHGAELVEGGLTAQPGTTLKYVRQEPQLGTGHAVQQALPALTDDGVTLVLSGDVPLMQVATLQALLAACGGTQLALLTLSLDDPTGYGRIVRDSTGAVKAIVEQKDALPHQLAIQEIYSGIMAVPTRLLRGWLARLDNQNAQAEYYLTDVVKFAVSDGATVVAHQITDAVEVAGVNSPAQLAELERAYQRRVAAALMAEGVRLADPARLDVRGTLTCGTDVEIDVNAIFEGRVHLGNSVRVGANCVIANATIAEGAVIHPFSHIDGEKLGVSVGAGALVGPYARLRPGAQLGAEVHIGNFVEVKNSVLADGAKANHLTYIGDATVGERVNVGAGTITANYDGANKHRTVIEADVHIGSNSVLVAPVTIGAGGTVGAGSVISRDTPPGSLAVARGRPVVIPNWSRPAKKSS